MKKIKNSSSRKKFKLLFGGLTLACFVLAVMAIVRTSSASTEKNSSKNGKTSLAADPNLPEQIDVRGGTPRGLDTRALTAIQIRALSSLQSAIGSKLNVRYNGLTATPMNIFNPNGYLTAPSQAAPEQIARDFIGQWREVFRFSSDDLNNLKLQSRAVSAEGITVMLFQQQANGVPVYHGEVLVNVNRAGQIMTVGGDSFPRMSVTNAAAISPAAAVTAAASSLGVSFAPQSMGAAQVLATYGNLTPEYQTGEKFSGGGVFGDDIEVHQVVFPVGDTGRLAYQFNLTTPQYHGMMWENIVDAQDGTILRRISLTSDFGDIGGGTGANRRGTFRPDVQNALEANNGPGSAQGKVVDTMPTSFSGYKGIGRATRTGTDENNFMYTRPTYAAETETVRASGRGFKYSLVFGRNEDPLYFGSNTSPVQSFTQAQLPGITGQVARSFPDASNPSASSPFGWFYLPTGSSGSEITSADVNRATTRDSGYTTSAEAKTRNLAANSPNGDGDQPFSADLTPLSSTVTLADGRSLNSVYQSRYAEGNNVGVSDDRANDNETTSGVKAFSLNRQFTADYYKYFSSYEFGGVNATGGGTGATAPVVYPASSNADVYPGAVNLFYFNNVEHDYLYSVGFTEPFWNFQLDNFGKGGAGGDNIIAQVQDGSGTDNANMSSPAEGSNPRMQMFLFTDTTFRRSDGDLDWDVVAHEHYHGVSNRSAAKGGSSCLGTPLVGESGGMGEGWSDTIASSLSDDDSEGEYVTGEFDKGIRRLPYTNYRWSYGSLNGTALNVRRTDSAVTTVPDPSAGSTPFEVHNVGEVWAAALWDMRELMIVKQKINGTYPGIFFDGSKRLGGGTTFFVGERAVQSVDTFHPINYRTALTGPFATTSPSTATPPGPAVPAIVATRDIIRPGLLATENAANPQRSGPLATAVSKGGRLADIIVLRGLQLAPCNPTFVDMRDSMIAADREITGGENIAIIWRSFASHGIGSGAMSSGKTNGTGQQGGPAVIVEDFTVPADVAACEVSGPLPAPGFTLSNTANNSVTVTIAPVSGATSYIVARSTNPNGPFVTVGTVATPSYTDTGLVLNQTYYYQVHAARNTSCIGAANTNSITITVGAALSPAPIFAGVGQVADTRSGSTLTLSWSPATSLNVGANIVYDIYRVVNVPADTDLTAPSFTPAAGNLIKSGATGTSYIDPNLTLGQQYYYIVRARDTTNSKIDTNNVGNTVTKLNAPSTRAVSATPPFAIERFNDSTGNSRFTPMLVESGTAPNRSVSAFQRADADLGDTTTLTGKGAETDATQAVTGVMYAPDFDPGNLNMGAQSDFYTTINPTGLTRASFLEFDHKFNTEATFDGNNIEIVLGASTAPVTPVPNNTTTYDLNDFIVQNGYSGNLDGLVEGAMSSLLLGRRSYTGSGDLSHVKVAIGDFAPGGVKNPDSLPVYIRFHTTSDSGTNADGWYVDNLVVNNYVAPAGLEADVAPRPNGDGVIQSDDVVQMRRFLNGSDTPDATAAEFQKADSAPRSTSGDGLIQSDDVVQTRRYLNGSDALQNVGGPNTPTNSFAASKQTSAAAKNSKSKSGEGDFAQKSDSRMQIDPVSGTAGQPVKVNIRVDASGRESEYGFVVNYDPAKLSNPVVGAGESNAGGRSCSVRTAGKIVCSVGSFADNNSSSGDSGIGEIANGSQVLISVTFNVAAGAAAGVTPVSLTEVNASDDNAQKLSVAASNGNVTIAAASTAPVGISGRALTANGKGINGATLTLRDERGASVKVNTNAFGYFSFGQLNAGRQYVLSIQDKRYKFAQPSRTVVAADNLGAISFIGN